MNLAIFIAPRDNMNFSLVNYSKKVLNAIKKSDAFPHLLPYLIVAILLSPILIIFLYKVVRYLILKI